MSTSKVFGIFCLMFVLLLTITGPGFAQDKQPSQPPTVPPNLHFPPEKYQFEMDQLDKRVPFLSQPALAGNPQGLTLGTSGLSFRYVQTFGVTDEPYPADAQHLNHPYGIFIDNSDNLYVVEEEGFRLLKYNSSGDNVMILGHVGMPWHHDDYLATPRDVASDANNNIWVVMDNCLKEFDATGTVIQLFPDADPWNAGSDNEHFNSPRGIAFDGMGRMYVADTWNHRIQVYTFNVSGIPVYSATIGVANESGMDNAHFNEPQHIAIYGDSLYIVDAANQRVQIFTIGASSFTYSGTIGVSGEPGSDNNHLAYPFGVTVDANYIYVTEGDNNRVQIFNRSTHAYTATMGEFGIGNNQFWNPRDVAVDSAGNIFVADYLNMRVQKFNSSRIFQRSYGETSTPYQPDAVRYNNPWGITVATDGSIYFLEARGRRLVKLNTSGIQQWVVGEAGVDGNDNNHFSGPAGNPALDSAGRIYVTDSWNHRIQIFDSNGVYSASIGSYGTGNYQFNCPTGVAINPANNDIYIPDTCNHRVMVYNSSLVYKTQLGMTGVAGFDNTTFDNPQGVAIDQAGNVYVADRWNYRVQKCNVTGINYSCSTFAGVTGESGNDFNHLGLPLSVAVDGAGRVYVADEWNSRIQVFDSSGAYLTTIGGNSGNQIDRINGPLGVAVDQTGNVYVTDTNNHRIQKYAPGIPGWKQANINGFGDRNNSAANRMSVFNNYLYAGTINDSTGGEVWRSANGTDWNQVNLDGFGDAFNTIAQVGETFNGNMYVGTSNSPTGGEIWRCAICDGSDWTQVVSAGFGDSTNTSVERVVVFSNTLYATANSGTGVEVWKSSTGNPGSWTQSNTDGFGNTKNTGLWAVAVLNNYLYAATAQWGVPFDTDTYTGTEVWRTNDGITWSQVNTNGFGDRGNMSPWLESFNGYLYALLYNNFGTGSQIWRCAICDGTDWTQVVSEGFGDSNNGGGGFMFSFGGHFYTGTYNNITGTEIWQTTNGTNWSQVNVDGHGDSNNGDTRSGAVFNGRLFFGTLNWANGAGIWTMTSPIPTSIIRTGTNPTGATNVNFTVTFSQSVTGVDAGDFSLTTSGVLGASVSGVSGSGSIYTVTVNTGSGSGSIRLNVIDNDSIVDGANTPLGGAGAGNGDFTIGETYTITKTWIFGDVPNTYWSWGFIERLYNAGITGGCKAVPLNYCPTTPVTRAQMAIFLLRGMHGKLYTPPPATGTKFTDVPLGAFGAAWIEQLATEGITSGCGGGNYCPNTTVSRAQMAIFLVRAKHGVAFVPPTATGIFPDVPVGSFGANYIEQLVADAITSGCGGGLYCPNTMVKRDSMAVFLVKTFNLP